MLFRVLSFSIALLMTASCAVANFQPEVDEFYAEAMGRRCFAPLVPIYFARLESDIAGYCVPSFGILLNENGWSDYEPFQKKELIFHELGHCSLNLEHTEEGIMAPKMHREKDLKANWNQWVDDIFKDCLKY